MSCSIPLLVPRKECCFAERFLVWISSLRLLNIFEVRMCEVPNECPHQTE